MFLSVVFPAYNEEGSIEQVVLDHERVLDGFGGKLAEWEIVCLDDKSKDGTLQILHQLVPRVPKLRILEHEKNRGIYQSFADLFAAARGTHIYLTASDGQWPADNLVKMLQSVEAGADLVVGVRHNRAEIYSASRRVVSSLFNFFPQLLFGVKTSDAGSVKLGLREIFNLDLISRSPFVEAERIISARRRGYRVDFVPIRFLRRSAGKEGGASWRNIKGSTRDLMRCIRAYGIGSR